jgi:hypothetical protein
MYFLVTATLETTHYMAKSTKEEIMRLVEADSEDEAEQKFRKHFEDKRREYDVSYWVQGVEVHETIT